MRLQKFILINNKHLSARQRRLYPGFRIFNGFLYEGTGRKGSSSIRKVELTTGKVLQQKDIDAQYFGEGITIFNNKLYPTYMAGRHRLCV